MKKISYEEIMLMNTELRDTKFSVHQALENFNASKIRQENETVNRPTYGADYGAIERRIAVNYLESLKGHKKSIFRKLITKYGPSSSIVSVWERKYKGDSYTPVSLRRRA